MDLAFTVHGPAVAWMRAGSRYGVRYTPKRLREYQDRLGAEAARLRPAGWPMDADYSVTLWYVPHDRVRRDLDNVAKTVLDAMNGVLWDDDSAVSSIQATRVRPSDAETPRLAVCVSVIGVQAFRLWPKTATTRTQVQKRKPNQSPSGR